MPPIHLDAPRCLDATVCLGTPIVWMSLIPLDATIHLAVSKHTVGKSNIWRASKHMVASKHTGGIQTYRGHPNIWGASECMGAYGHPLV